MGKKAPPAWWSDEQFVDRILNAHDDAAKEVSDFLREAGVDLPWPKMGRVVGGLSPWGLSGARSPLEELFYVAAAPRAFLKDVRIEHEPPGFGTYLPDFALTRETPSGDFEDEDFHWIEEILIVELDGHEFHERTREQAEHDKRRDRWFTANGYRVIRFTGREVWRDAAACAAEALTFFTTEGRANG